MHKDERKAMAAAYAALKMVALDTNLRKVVKALDPKAYEQVQDAILGIEALEAPQPGTMPCPHCKQPVLEGDTPSTTSHNWPCCGAVARYTDLAKVYAFRAGDNEPEPK